MKLDFIRFEKHLVRLALGAAFSVEIVTLIQPGIVTTFIHGLSTVNNAAGPIASSSLCLITILSASSVGAGLLNVIINHLSWTTRFVLKNWSWLAKKLPEVVYNVHELAVIQLNANKDELMKFSEARTIGLAHTQERFDFAKKHFTERYKTVVKFLNEYKSSTLLNDLTIFCQIDQEKAVDKTLETHNKNIISIYIIVVTGIINLWLHPSIQYSLLHCVIAMLISLPFTIPAYIRQKRQHAIHRLYLLIDMLVTIEEGTDIIDREVS